MSEPLFRREVLEARQRRWLGGISLVHPQHSWLLACCVTVACLGVIAFLALGEYTRRSRVAGYLVPDLGMSTVVAPTDGIVARLFTEEGSQVRTNDALAVINIPRATTSGGDISALIRRSLNVRQESLRQLEESQMAQADARKAGYQQQLAIARQELAQIRSEIRTRSDQVRMAQETVARYRDMVREHYVSQVQLTQQQQALLELINARQALERQAIAQRQNIAQLEQSLREMPPGRAAAQAVTRRDAAALEQERIEQQADGELLIQAPVTGLVANRMIEPGQTVRTGQPLISLLPQGSQLLAQLMVPSASVGFIEVGDRVLLRYRAYPYQKFGHQQGKVIRISRSPVGPSESIPRDEQATADLYYRVLVKLDRQSIMAYGQAEALRPGMALEADILGERRRLYAWALEPLYSISGKL